MRTKLIFAAALLAATSASAVTMTSQPGAPDPGALAGQTVIDNFEAPVAGIVYSGSYTVGAGNVANTRAAPAGDMSSYFSVPKNGDAAPKSAMIDFTGYLTTHDGVSSLSFYWGSIDAFNTIELIGTGLTGLTIYSGLDLIVPADGNQTLAQTNRRVNFTFAAGETLTGLKLTSAGKAFEIDDIAVGGAVPEPAAWSMMVIGFGLVGAATRRRTHALAA